MDALPSKASDGCPTTSDRIPLAHARIFKACLKAGLTRSDSEDVAQDIWLWLLRVGRESEAFVTPWLGAVAQNFIRRYWRRRKRRSVRESQAGIEPSAFHPVDAAAALDSRLSLDRMEARLPVTEASLLRLVRSGLSFAQAVRQLGIPRGSRSFFRKRLIAHLREGLRAPQGSPRH
jgi:DNA-directed RNA polymerase specialized sigma24 family protein